MRRAHLAAGAALVLSVTGGLPLVASAHADASVLYVSRTAACSDGSPDSGSQWTPFCTISAAAAVVQPGQTVQVGKGDYNESVQLTRSGTPSAPISFVGPNWTSSEGLATVRGGPIGLVGVHDVTVRNFNTQGAHQAVLVQDSSRITVDHIRAASNDGTSQATIRITGQSDSVTLSRSMVPGTPGDAIAVDPGVTHAVLTTNVVAYAVGRGIAVTDAPGTVVTSNTIQSTCGPAVELAGNSSGSTAENNVLMPGDQGFSCSNPQRIDLAVSAASAVGSVADYNVVSSKSQTPYSWAGQTYADVASFRAASKQGAHDVSSTGISLGSIPEGSAVIDSADANAPGELSTDFAGRPRVDDPLVANTGTGVGYYDRGAYEFQDPMRVSVSGGPSYVVGHPFDAIVKGSVTASWPSATSSVDFGDGSAAVSSPAFPLTHTYPGPGTYTVTLKATDPYVGTKTATAWVTIQPIGPVQPNFTINNAFPGQPLHVSVITDGTGSPWTVTKNTIDFGDGTVVNAAVVPAENLHDYASPGTYTVTDTMTDDHGRTGSTSRTVTIGSDYVPLPSPTRILDSRVGLGAPTEPVAPGGVLKLQVTGRAGVPADGNVTAVLLNLTATDATEATHITAFPGGAVPTASNLNITPGHDVGNAVIVPVAPDGTVSFFNHAGNVDLVADVEGYYTTQPHGSGLNLGAFSAPIRAFDTRPGGAPLGPGGTIRVPVRGPGRLPDSAQVAVLNLTATDGTENSYVTAAPNGTPPTNSSLNFSAGQTVANQITVPINSDGTVTLYNHTGSVDLIVDIQGFYGASGGAALLATAPTRVLDTRDGTGGSSQKLGPDSTVKVKVAGVAGLPANVLDVVVNLTATDPTDVSWLNVYPSGSMVRSTSNINVTPGATVPNLAVVPVGPDGCIEIYNHSGSTNVVVDLQGYTA